MGKPAASERARRTRMAAGDESTATTFHPSRARGRAQSDRPLPPRAETVSNPVFQLGRSAAPNRAARLQVILFADARRGASGSAGFGKVHLPGTTRRRRAVVRYHPPVTGRR